MAHSINSNWLRYDEVVGASDLLIVFSHTNYPEGKFAQSRALLELKANRLFVNCPENSWYQVGIGDPYSDVDGLATALREIIIDVAPTRVFTTGMSMGGYAAILFGMLLDVNQVIAFTAELQIGEVHSRSWVMNRTRFYDFRYRDLGRLLNRNNSTKISLIYGGYDWTDLGLCWTGADFLAGSCLSELIILGGAHLVTKRFNVLNVINACIENRDCNGEFDPKCLVRLPSPEYEEILLWREIDRLKREKKSPEILNLISERRISWDRSNLCLELSNAHLNAGQVDKAESQTLRGLQLDVASHPLWHSLGLIRIRQGLPDEAVCSFEKAVELEPSSGSSHLRLALAAEKIGRLDKATVSAKNAIRLMPQSVEALQLFERLTH